MKGLRVSVSLLATGMLLAACGGGGGSAAMSSIPNAAMKVAQSQGSLSPRLANPTRIYVANENGQNVTTYLPNGTQTTPTITANVNTPVDVAVDANGKIYVANLGNSTVTTYLPDGTQTTPTITTGLNAPGGVAVDANGKIYVANETGNNVTTYLPDGTQTTPTITQDVATPTSVAVDANGTIYVTNFFGGVGLGSVTKYRPNGHEYTPTFITSGLNGPYAVAVSRDPNRIYVANFEGSPTAADVTTYKLNGTQTTPTIAGPPNGNAAGVATDASGKIYVTDFTNENVTIYKPHGQQTPKIITSGLDGPIGIAIH